MRKIDLTKDMVKKPVTISSTTEVENVQKEKSDVDQEKVGKLAIFIYRFSSSLYLKLKYTLYIDLSSSDLLNLTILHI